ncbi:hypothetical protein [Salisediminibacterium beveridgei]|uniref:Uncharacterized protein n=1 Tax=Salisediminibacterium beveridgei TaxID=632773 RepID=A0A1D7QWZ7_9BACI|nr:hypothetical protein [Salisediminibacterium beveridgei]AOM83489.1 hypothetical protein BBEV_2131 [Salisediminibacterium beveridgei]
MSVQEKRQTAVILFGFRYTEIRKLALVNIEKDPDQYYMGLEPQWIKQKDGITGYRVIAYRLDGYVDVYDEPQLVLENEQSFDVTGKGLCERITTTIKNVAFFREQDRLRLSFSFLDKYGRHVQVKIQEHSTKSSKGVSLLAPVGSSSLNPTYLPVFFLYQFDFVRKRGTEASVKIDDQEYQMDPFPYPVPKDMQWRYYARYSDDCQIVEFAPSFEETLKRLPVEENGVAETAEVKYTFSENSALQRMEAITDDHPLEVIFSEGIPDIRTIQDNHSVSGLFSIRAKPEMGTIEGKYIVERQGSKVTLMLLPEGGWCAVPDSLFTKLMFQEKSVFRQWPATYEYKQVIDLETLHSTSAWRRVKESAQNDAQTS